MGASGEREWRAAQWREWKAASGERRMAASAEGKWRAGLGFHARGSEREHDGREVRRLTAHVPRATIIATHADPILARFLVRFRDRDAFPALADGGPAGNGKSRAPKQRV